MLVDDALCLDFERAVVAGGPSHALFSVHDPALQADQRVKLTFRVVGSAVARVTETCSPTGSGDGEVTGASIAGSVTITVPWCWSSWSRSITTPWNCSPTRVFRVTASTRSSTAFS